MTSRFSTSIEPLEARIAPALLVNGANLLGGAGNPTSGDTSVGDNSVTLVKVLSGQALVWFENGNISSISFGPNTSLEIFGDIDGDVVGNLTAAGTLSDSDGNPVNGEDGAALLANNLVGLKTHPLSSQKGSLDNIITGGSISGLSISGELFGAYAGDGVFRPESYVFDGTKVVSSVGGLDINPVASGTQTTFDFTKADATFLPGASIKTAKITLAPALQLFAGNGNPTNAVLTGTPGPAGGAISSITIESAVVPPGAPVDTPSYWLIAGDGADGKTGGAGGAIDHIIEKASFGLVRMNAGHGGAGAAGAGGAGGAIAYLDVQSNSAHYIVKAGAGGNGAPAGDGGRLLLNNFANRTPVSGLIKAADFTGDGIDDILVIDASTGQMVINTQQGAGGGANAPFHELVQYVDVDTGPVVLIDPNGVSPTDALVMDVDGDNRPDIVVAYKNSNSLGVFINQGGGHFFDSGAGTNGVFASASLGLSFSPAKIATDGGSIVIAENSEGKGIMRYGFISGTAYDDLLLDVTTGKNEFSQPVADVVYANGKFITAFTSGTVAKLGYSGFTSKKPFTVQATTIAIAGGIDDLELDSTGKRLLALSDTGHTLTVYDVSGTDMVRIDSVALSANNAPLAAHFVHDSDSATEDDISVLALPPVGSVITTYTQQVDGDPLTADPYAISSTLTYAKIWKNFVPAYDATGFIGEAALAGSMNSFTFTPDLATTAVYPLPFANKIIDAFAGKGGTGLNLGKLVGKGGAGGTILGINADANEMKLHAGDGGSSGSGPAGAGGSVSNPLSFVTSSALMIVPGLTADVLLEIEAGDGGTPTGPAAKTAAGGAGGSLVGLTITLAAGDITLTTGTGGDGNGGAGGAGGNFSGMRTISHDGSLAISTGAGGKALSGAVAGGAGGSILNYRHELDLDEDTERLENKYSVTMTTGDGGSSAEGVGGAGGGLGGVTLTLDGADRTYDDVSNNSVLKDADRDSTVRISVTTGDGGQGATGGAGGVIRDFSHTSVFDQVARGGGILLNYVAMQLTAGAGGEGTAGSGGAGGGILFSRPISGVTFFDPDANEATDPANRVPFIATAGAGGDGTLKGGAGGAVTGLKLQNSPFTDGASISGTNLESGIITAGKGGDGGTSDGGAGGAVTGAMIGTQAKSSGPEDLANGIFKNELEGGFLTVTAGNGGNGGAAGKGGVGGTVASSTFGVVKTVTDLGMSITAGNGGAGGLGGAVGGALSTLQISTPQSTAGISAILLAGSGGAGTSNKALGGKGGDVSGVNQGKDVNSSINLIQAGNGGANPFGTGGAGGNINGIKTVGFIGRPSDGSNRLGAFDQIGSGLGATEIAQGLFAGRGGDGLLDGINGAVSKVTARQIAAIAAAVDAGGLFAAASKISDVKAALIGFDLDAGGSFDSSVPGTPQPSLSKPIDGFIYSATPLAKVTGLPASPSFVFIG
ncbi:MAG: VCBS repeat-containing protein [Chthoniobacteraceae bacterium]